MAINVINLNNGKIKKKLKINDYIWAMQINSTQCEINETNKPKKKIKSEPIAFVFGVL